MLQIAPFRGLRYNTERFSSDLSALIAPPYDVLDASDKAALLRKHERNIVAVDLPHMPPKTAGPDEVYARAADLLNAWRGDGTLRTETRPVIYVYHQQYEVAGRSYVRRMFFARMRLEEFGAGTVFPHERTFGGPKEDRLKLMQATRCQLSAVFGLYSDPSGGVSALLNVPEDRPDATGEMDGVANRLWVLADESRIRELAERMAHLPLYIADGHHRYGTALTYRDQLNATAALPADHPARFVLVGFCAMEDPGCLILPTHRVISGLGGVRPDRILAALEEGVQMRAVIESSGPEQLLGSVTSDDIGIFLAATDGMYLGRFTHREKLRQLSPDRSEAYRRLDLAYLHDYLIDQLLTGQALGGAAPTVQYTHSATEAIRMARDSGGVAFMTRPCTMADLRAVSEANDLMPQKSTFFFPKLATGLVINPLE
ncbi:MAG: hypothetical protein AMXMBFR13_13800 [Phycisphaerae bacterium]